MEVRIVWQFFSSNSTPPVSNTIQAATLSFGLFFFQANSLQQAVDVAAQEISRMPFPPTAELGLGDLNAATDTVMYDDEFRRQIYDEQYLVIDQSEWDIPAFGNSFQEYLDTLPLLNRQLANVMVRDDSLRPGVVRYPGAVVINSVHPDGPQETVLVPLVAYDQTNAAETIVQWVAPVEEIRPGGGGQGPYSLTATNGAASFVAGMVALRINYPASSTTLVNRTGNEGQNITRANNSSITNENTGSNYTLAVAAESGPAATTIHSGRYGLGRQAALFEANGIRPYRTVISVQAIYRREVFE